MAEMGPMLKTALRLFGYGGDKGGRQLQIDNTVDAAAAGQPAPNQPAPAPTPRGQQPAVLTPEQESDLRALGSGHMRLNEFVAKHGFVPR